MRRFRSDTRDRLADALNRMRPGQEFRLTRDLLAEVEPTGSVLSPVRGLAALKEYVMGSAVPEVWDFQTDLLTGDVIARRKGE